MFPVKVKMKRFNNNNLWVYRNLSRHTQPTSFPELFPLKIEAGGLNFQREKSWERGWSLNVTSKVISNRIIARISKSTGQYDGKLFFRLDCTCNSMVELSNSTGKDFGSTINFNASTGEEYCDWFVCGTKVAFDIKQVDFTPSHLFFPRPANFSRQFTPNGNIFA